MKETQFKPGQSGNPKGRVKGKPLLVTELRTAIEAKSDEIFQAVINAAINGDMSAAKILIDKICPSLKPEAMPINLVFQESLALQGNEIIKAIMGGILAPDIGSALIAAVSNQAKIVEIDDLTKRIEALESTK
jgi:hypothetical protein